MEHKTSTTEKFEKNKLLFKPIYRESRQFDKIKELEDRILKLEKKMK